jgi:hypothetical protein
MAGAPICRSVRVDTSIRIGQCGPVERRPAAILKVQSVRDSVSWYQRVGFEIDGDPPGEDDTWAEVAHGSLVLQFLSGETPWPSSPTFTGCFYVHAQSVEEVLENIREAVRPEWGIEHRPWGAVELTIQDPDGYYLTFTQEGAP